MVCVAFSNTFGFKYFLVIVALKSYMYNLSLLVTKLVVNLPLVNKLPGLQKFQLSKDKRNKWWSAFFKEL